MIIVSNSEANQWQQCKRKYLYAYGHNLQSKKTEGALDLGIAGHSMTATYYEKKRQGGSKTESVRAALSLIGPYIKDEGSLETAAILSKRQQEYADMFWDEPWTVLDVEGYYEIPLSSDISFGMKCDLLVAQNNRSIKVVDHKWTYDFKKEIEFTHNSQIPKYVGALRTVGIEVENGVLNEMRYRKDAKQAFKRSPVIPKQREIDRLLQEQHQVSEEIAEFRGLPLETQRQKATRNMSRWNCDYCPFKDLCKADLMGENIDTMIERNFEPNEYGYRKHENVPGN